MELASIFNAEGAEDAEESGEIYGRWNRHYLVSLVHAAFLSGSLRPPR
jgi:hypothetical protein